MATKVSENHVYLVPFLQTDVWVPQEDVPCREDPDAWGEIKPGASRKLVEKLKQICKEGCPVTEKCLEQALIEEGMKGKQYRYGIRGGMGAKERHAIYKARKPSS